MVGEQPILLLLLLFWSCNNLNIVNSSKDEGEILIEFKQSLTSAISLHNWNNPSIPPCKANWIGVVCFNGNITGLRLNHMRLQGMLDFNSLLSLIPHLRSLSFINNSLFGPIPSSIVSLSTLIDLRLDANQFQGRLPDFQFFDHFKAFNFSNNQLEGPIPITLSHMDSTSFSGNKNLCGPPLTSCLTETIDNRPFLMFVLAMVFGAVLGLTIAVLRHRIKVKTDREVVSFVRDDRERWFDSQDIREASLKTMGGGTLGASYKATIPFKSVVFMKEYKQMNNVGRDDEFREYMTRLGSLTHPNLLPLLAYYYSKERKVKKLLFYDFVDNRCLASHLHGNGPVILDWPTRFKIIKGIARGLSYLHTSLPNIRAPHGHLKSSNVVLNHDTFDHLLTDYALIPVIDSEHRREFMMAYKSPEYSQLRRVTKKTDVWSFGIVILEILTAKFPENYLTRNHDIEADLATWVEDMIYENRTTEVFDVELGKARDKYKAELLKMLRIGLDCCEEDVDMRLDLNELLIKIEELSCLEKNKLN